MRELILSDLDKLDFNSLLEAFKNACEDKIKIEHNNDWEFLSDDMKELLIESIMVEELAKVIKKDLANSKY